MNAFRSSPFLLSPSKNALLTIGNNAAPPPHQDQPISNVNSENELSDLEDLPSQPDEEEEEVAVVAEKEANIGKTNEELVQLSMDLLRAFTPHTPGPADPVLALNTLYQKRGVVSITNYFTDHKVDSGAFWSSFACPLNGIDYSSGLPLPLFAKKPDDRLVELAQTVFGKYVLKQDQVVFGTKRGAKRAAAFAVLEAHRMTGIDAELIVSAVEGTAEEEESGPVKNKKAKIRNVPPWVHELHGVGIDASSLEISYRERLSEGDDPLRFCQLCCVITVRRKPQPLMAISLPMGSKRLALENAVMLLTEQMKQSSMVTPPKGIKQLSKILERNTSVATYVKPLPRWATEKMRHDRTIYLYRLQLLTSTGTDFVASRSGLVSTTPLGVMFASPLPNTLNATGFEAKFEILDALRDKPERVTAMLTDRTEIVLSEEQFRGLWQFNRQICLWKDYGQQSSTNKNLPDKDPASSSISLIDRTYTFAPLIKDNSTPAPAIDHELIRKICDWEEISYYSKRFGEHWTLPLIGPIDVYFVSAALACWSLVILIPDLVQALPALLDSGSPLDISFLYRSAGNVCGTTFALVSLVMPLLFLVLPPRKQVGTNTLQNRFFVEKKGGARPVHVTPSKDHFADPVKAIQTNLTGRSKVCNPLAKGPSPVALELNLRKYKLDLRTASFVELYHKRFGIQVKYPGERLLQGIPVRKHPDHDFIFKTKEQRHNHLVPELVEVLAMPRDLLYILKQSHSFMPPLERAIELESLAVDFHETLNSLAETTRIKWKEPTSHEEVRSALVTRLDEALTVATYQRLEFLGDSVLGFFLAVNLMSRNSSLNWDNDDLSEILADAGKNKTLYDAALRIGAGRLLWSNTKSDTFRTVFHPRNSSSAPLAPQAEMMQTITKSRHSDYRSKTEVDKVLSDVVESTLGAVYMAGKSGDSKCMKMVIGLFEGLKLPMSGIDKTSEQDSAPWFQGTSSCFSSGYDFASDEKWQMKLVEIGTILYCDTVRTAKLEQGHQDLVRLLTTLSGDPSIQTELVTQSATILLMCSLFDDSLRDVETQHSNSMIALKDELPKDSSESNVPDKNEESGLETGIFQAALLRDTINLVGSYALQLCLTTEVFCRYPDAKEGQLHVLRACAQADDVIVYIMFKAGIQKLLLDQSAPAITRFQSMLEMADSRGRKEWAKRGGWILPGGATEFAARCSAPRRIDNPLQPQYYGVGGGRVLLEQEKGAKQKLPEAITSDFVFSFKSIVGALVLSLGMERMWTCIGPLFEEVMLLSPVELRQEFKGLSSIVQ